MKAILVVDIPNHLKVEDVKIKYELFDKTNGSQIYGNYNLNNLKPIKVKKTNDIIDEEYDIEKYLKKLIKKEFKHIILEQIEKINDELEKK